MLIDETPEQAPLQRLLNAGVEISGAGTGALVGGAVSGLPGAIAGAVVPSIVSLAADFVERSLSPREKARIGALMHYALLKMRQNAKSKKPLRDDDFFTDNPRSRAAFKEVLEAVIRSAQRDPQEKKLKFYGNLLGNIPYEYALDRSMANLFVRTAEELSYRQLCLLALFGTMVRNGFSLRSDDYHREDTFTGTLLGVLQETFELYHRGLLTSDPQSMTDVVLQPIDIRPARTHVEVHGWWLCSLMELEEVERLDVAEIVDLLNYEGKPQ